MPASTYALPEKDVENHTGIVVEILSPSFNLLNHSEVPFSSEVLSKCTNSIGGKPNSLYNHYVQNILPVKDGYVIVTEQQTSVTVAMGANNTASKTAYGNLVCICLDGQLKEQKQLLVRSVNQKMNFVIFEEQGSYVLNNRVYIFHPGSDDKVKNTDDEFDLYCTTWEGGTANPEPKTVEVPRPYKDLHMYPSDLRVLAPNKLLIFGRGNGGDVWTTMEITE
jgi:hypothetical protein